MNAQQAAYQRIATREYEIRIAESVPRNAPPTIRAAMLKARGLSMAAWRRALGLKRLNVESATRRSLVGAKGMRP